MRALKHLALCAILAVPCLGTFATVSLGVEAPAAHVPPGADLNPSQDHSSPYLRVFGVTPPPYGHVEMCAREPEECKAGIPEEGRRSGKGAAFTVLDRVNRQVNAEIQPMTDWAQYGVEDYWTVPKSGKGDCEDYALMKRQRLILSGWPVSALLMTVVYDEKKEGHAVLLVRAAEGDLILDNKVDTIKLWSATPYEYVMRESYLEPHIWMSLDPHRAAPSVAIPVAGLRGAK